MVSQWNYPFYSIKPKWCLTVFRSISQTFGMSKDAKLVFRAWMHYFVITKLRKWFHNETNHSTSVNPKCCLRVFRSNSQTFGTSKDTKQVFRAWMHCFGVPKWRKWFRMKILHSTPLDPNWCLGVFWSISQTVGTWKDVKLVFRPWMHFSVITKLRKRFHNETIHSTPVDPKWCLGVFRSIYQTSNMSKYAKHVFRAWMHYFVVTKLQKWFRNETIHSIPVNQNDV